MTESIIFSGVLIIIHDYKIKYKVSIAYERMMGRQGKGIDLVCVE